MPSPSASVTPTLRPRGCPRGEELEPRKSVRCAPRGHWPAPTTKWLQGRGQPGRPGQETSPNQTADSRDCEQIQWWFQATHKMSPFHSAPRPRGPSVLGMCQNSLLVAENYSTVCGGHVLCVPSSGDGHRGWFHVVAGMNNAAVNMGARCLSESHFRFFWVPAWKWNCRHAVVLT